ncbi:MFS transporter [Brumicola pallidula]|uniref:Inner membrane transport protein yajR n=1 Tax=Brumicola pallidula DSM 14239 = ACAM 615 TaxID=1121922 RepID=K6YD77_9ALTE|nr:MFS transporter [Glaciecola pallidula]GAC30694.1 inner membrane transport protein yajR [Glaciecola pallidula DSM 14239 = ACAM 615]
MNPQETRAAISLALVYVLRMLGLFMVIPVLAIAAVDYPDYSPLFVGLAIGGYGLTQAILQIPMGVLSDKWGRKPVIYMGLCFFALGSLVAANADSMAMLTLGRILQGAGAIAGAIMALAADVTRESERAKVMAIIGVSIGFSFYVALLTGPIIAGLYGIQGIFWITAVLTICCLPLVKFGVPTPKESSPSGDALPQLSQLKTLAKEPSLWRLNISVLTVHLLITCFFVQVPVLLTEVNFGLDEHWKIYTPILFVSVLILVMLMKLCKHLQTSTSFIISLTLMAMGFGLFLLPELNWAVIIIAGTLFFAGFNYMEAHMPVMVSSIAPAGKKGSAMGIYASFQFFGAFLGGVISGALTGWLGPKLALVACLIFIVIAMIIVWGLQKTTKVKRVTLTIENRDSFQQTSNKTQLESDFGKLEGVQEVLVDVEKRAVYLKVDNKGFDIEKAKALIS